MQVIKLKNLDCCSLVSENVHNNSRWNARYYYVNIQFSRWNTCS